MLAALGDPWQPDPTLSDDEPLPEYPTGGDGAQEPADRVLKEGRVNDVLVGNPPTNPDLRAVWREEGLLDEVESPQARRGVNRTARKTRPAPNQGG